MPVTDIGMFLVELSKLSQKYNIWIDLGHMGEGFVLVKEKREGFYARQCDCGDDTFRYIEFKTRLAKRDSE